MATFLVVGTFVLYHASPQFHDTVDQIVASATTSLDRMQRGNAEQNAKKQEQFASSFSNNGDNSAPTGRCNSSTAMKIYCYVVIPAIFTTLIGIAIATGGHNSDESLSKDTLKLETFTPNPTSTPSSTPISTPTSTPTKTPTIAPTSTPNVKPSRTPSRNLFHTLY